MTADILMRETNCLGYIFSAIASHLATKIPGAALLAMTIKVSTMLKQFSRGSLRIHILANEGEMEVVNFLCAVTALSL